MSFVWMTFLALLVVVAVVGRVDLRLRALVASIRARHERTHLENLDAIEAVQRRLLVGPLPVGLRVESGFRGRRVVLELDDVVLRLHLYGGADRFGRQDGDRRGGAAVRTAFLVRIDDTPDRGWQVLTESADGSSRFEGWLLERLTTASRPTGRERTRA